MVLLIAGEKLQSNLSRFVVSVWMFVVLVLTSSYIATLSSLLTVEQIQLASMENSIGYHYGSPIHGVIFRNLNFEDTRLKPYSTSEEYADALALRSKKGGVDAIVDEIPYIKEFLSQYPSGYSMVDSQAITSGFGFAFPPGSPLAPEISRQITRLREDGTLKMLEERIHTATPSFLSYPVFLNPGRKGKKGNGEVKKSAFGASGVMYWHELLSLTFICKICTCMDNLFYAQQVFDEMLLWAGAFEASGVIYIQKHKKINRTKEVPVGVIPDIGSWLQPNAQDDSDSAYTEIPVGVILNMRSLVGKTIRSSITITLFEFYKVNNHYRTRIVVHNRDTHGETLYALRSAFELLEKTKVQAIIGSDSAAEANLLAVLGDEARTPILSLSPSPTPSSHNHPYFLQIAHDETIQFKGIAAMAESFGWKNLIVVCEDTDNGRDMATFMSNAFREKGIYVTYRSLISTSASNELVQEELHKFLTMQTKVFVLHTSPSLASYLLLNAKDLGMMDEGYKWIVTSKTMDFINSMDGEVMESMQGANPLMEVKDINAYAIWAHDAVSALAISIERMQAVKSKYMEMNQKGKRKHKVGFWTKDATFTQKIGKPNSFSDNGLKAIIWPGGISSHSMQLRSKNLRIAVPARFRIKRLIQVNYDARTNSTVISGFCAEVFLTAFNAFSQDVAFDFIPFTNHTEVGIRNYNDLIDLVHSGEFDAAIGDITITANRSLYVDFTLPYTDLGCATLSRNADASMWIFMEPLSSNLWLVSACFFILLALVIWILEHRTNQEFQGQELQSNLSRFVVIVWLFFVLVLTSSYTATLSSLLTIQQIQLASKTTSIGYSFEAYADDLSRGSKKGGVDAIVDEIPYAKAFLAEYPSGYSMTVFQATTNGFGFAFPRGSPWAPEISRQIAKLREDGTLSRLESKWFNQESVDSVSTTKILSVKDLRGLFVISGGSMAAALFLFMIYSVHEKLHFSYTMLAGGKLAFILRLLVRKTANAGLYVLDAKQMFDDLLPWVGYDLSSLMIMNSLKNCFAMVQPIAQDDSAYTEIPVGVILNMRSWVGKTVHSCITIALSEFYKINDHYQTRIVVHNRDTQGETLHALRIAFELLEKTKVQAIIGSDSTIEAKLMAVLGDEAKIPILSLSPTPSSHNHPYFLQIAQDETIQFKGIAAMAESFGWKNLVIICEDTDNGRDMATFMSNAFREKSIYVSYRSLISTSASHELVQEELHKLLTMQTKVFVLHTSPSLASYLLLNAKDLGMMDEGYKWIITSKTMDFINSIDSEVMASMQGTVGFRSYIPQSSDLHKFTWKWRKEYNGQNPLMEVKDINAYAIWAHDAVSALAISVEKREAVKSKSMEMSGSRQKGTTLLNQMLGISFQGLGGVFQFTNGRVTAHALEIINVIGKREHRVGFWTKDASFTQKIGKPNSFSDNGLKAIIWPGGISSHSMRQCSKKLRIVVPQHSNSRRLIQVNYDARTNSTVVSGFCAEVFLAAFDAFSQDVAFDFIPFMNHTEVGIKNYNDLIDLVHSGEFDAAIGDITITANRSLYVDFTLPFTDLGLAKVSRNADASMWIFMEPLSSNLWLVSACFFILLALVIWILEHRTNQEFQGSRGQQVGTTIWFAFSTLVYAHKATLQKSSRALIIRIRAPEGPEAESLITRTEALVLVT
ncbi:hypothetical protein OSB04_003176 [Centaurea solstitialis]|uniref:Ionotropic glutamate receptor C-terminal domain-containing protein n=1 Tax=Centaurea solstitialis TaxID=347529 RepID=A0AA38TUC6_9ASTR|nr:hypothetical protein OSB04_003176 [Centaurea solstitialis]